MTESKPAAKTAAPKPTDDTQRTEPPAQSTAPAPAPQKKAITRKAVEMVLRDASQLRIEQADEADAGGKRRGAASLDDELQKVYREYVRQSHTSGKMLRVVCPASAERETVKRLRAAATEGGHGLSLGNVRKHPQQEGMAIVPFQTTKKRNYTKKTDK